MFPHRIRRNRHLHKRGSYADFVCAASRVLKRKRNIVYYLSNQGIDAQTLQRIRHDRPITTATLGKLCEILHCQPGDLLFYTEESEE